MKYMPQGHLIFPIALVLIVVIGFLSTQIQSRLLRSRLLNQAIESAEGRPAVEGAPAADGRQTGTVPDDVFAGSASCRVCHEREFEEWEGSQHASAARPFDAALDGGAFEPPRRVSHGSFDSEFRKRNGVFEVVTVGAEGERRAFEPDGVIAIEPLRQYLVPFPGGRWQVTELAYDPARKDWFDVFGEEDRQPHEWGFWANRGMNWNSQCAFCHMTNLQKNYDADTDSYRTTWSEWGVGCEQCHGPMGRHVEARREPPWEAAPPSEAAQELSARQTMGLCGSCHARREELTGAFKPGERFFDHYRPELPDRPNVYFADGQIRDEDFEYGSFLLSRMRLKGVTCLDCHNPHSGKLIVPVEKNGLCLTCHSAPGRLKGAPEIEPVEHSHHLEGSAGNLCVECHMPERAYMVRDLRRDHGFTSPDPMLTRELGIPNACSRCHDKESVDWAVEWTEEWYGANMDRRSRWRARLVAQAQDGDDAAAPTLSAAPTLLAMAKEEPIAAWRSVMVALLGQWAVRQDVQSFLLESLNHDHPLVQAAAIRALEPIEAAHAEIVPLLDARTRLVRLDAAWVLRRGLESNAKARSELEAYLANQSDQPAGALRLGELALAWNRLDEAEMWLMKAVDRDPATAWFHHVLGVVRHMRGKTAEAERALKTAGRLEPQNAEHPYALGLLYAEMGDRAAALRMLEEAVGLDPEFARAWYNVGLARAQGGDVDGGIDALLRAETLAPEAAEFPYARATLHFQRGEFAEARRAGAKSIEAAPDYYPARALLEQIP